MHSSIWDPQGHTRLPTPEVLTGSSRVCSVDKMGSQVGEAEGWVGKCQNTPSGPKHSFTQPANPTLILTTGYHPSLWAKCCPL